MKRISDLDEAKLGLQDRFTDRYVSDHISCYYSVLKSYVGGEPLTSAFAAAAAAAISSQAQQQQQQHSHPHQRIPDIEKIVSAWDLINAVFTPRTTQQTTTFIDNTLRYFEQRLTRYVESRVPNSLALERLAHKNFGFLDKVDAFLTATITTTTTNCGGKASVWAKVYFCLMCGRGDLAVKAASGNPLENAVIAFVRGVPGKRRAGATEAYVESNKSAPSEDLYYTAVLALVASKVSYVYLLNKHNFFKSTDDLFHFIVNK